MRLHERWTRTASIRGNCLRLLLAPWPCRLAGRLCRAARVSCLAFCKTNVLTQVNQKNKKASPKRQNAIRRIAYSNIARSKQSKLLGRCWRSLSSSQKSLSALLSLRDQSSIASETLSFRALYSTSRRGKGKSREANRRSRSKHSASCS